MKTKNNCPLCGKKSRLYLDYKKIDQGGFKLLKCQSCGLVFTHPLPDENFLYKYYQDYDSIGEQDNYYKNQTSYLKNTEKQFLKLTHQYNFNKIKPILDLGSGGGVFLNVLKKNGFKEIGVEVSRPAVEFAQKQYGVNCQVSDALAIDFENNSFGAVFMWDLLEHLSDPKKAVANAYSWLVKNGYLVIETPNNRALINKIILSLMKISIKWPAKWMFGYHHLFLYNFDSLIKLLQDSGFKVLSVKTKNTSANRIFPWSLKFFIPRIGLEIINLLTYIVGGKNKLLIVAQK